MTASPRPLEVAFVTGARGSVPSGLALAEEQLIAALRRRDDLRLDVRVAGGRSAYRHASRISASWRPASPGRRPWLAWTPADLLHLSGLEFPPPPPGRDFVVSMHDVASMRYADESPFPEWTPRLVHRARRIVTSTAAGASDIAEAFDLPQDRFRVVPLGPGQVTGDVGGLRDEELEALGLRRPFVIRIGGYTQRKNVPLLMAAWPEVHRRTGAMLALVGPPHPEAGALRRRGGPSDAVVALTSVPGGLLPRLLASASMMVSPSLYEGFGLPPLEAMALGVPVVAVRTAATAEVCADAARLVPNDAGALSRAMVEVLEVPEVAEALTRAGRDRASRFDWDRTAAGVRAVYADLRRPD